MNVFTQLPGLWQRGARLVSRRGTAGVDMIRGAQLRDPMRDFFFEALSVAGLRGLSLQFAAVEVAKKEERRRSLETVRFADLVTPFVAWIEGGRIELLVAPAYTGITASLEREGAIDSSGRALPFVRVGVE